MNEAEFSKVLLEVVPQLIRFIRSEVRGAAPDVLTVPQFRILANINRGLRTVSEIAEHHGVSQPAMTKMVNGLEKRGLIRRRTSDVDVRRTILSLTPKGKNLYQKTRQKAQRRLAKRLTVLTPSERKMMAEALRGLQAAILDKRNLKSSRRNSV